jgi:hypothetical protein
VNELYSLGHFQGCHSFFHPGLLTLDLGNRYGTNIKDVKGLNSQFSLLIVLLSKSADICSEQNLEFLLITDRKNSRFK